MWGYPARNNQIVLALAKMSDAFDAHMKEEDRDRRQQRELLRETNNTLVTISEKVTKLETDLLLQQERHQTDRHEVTNTLMTHIRDKYVTKEMLSERFKVFGILWAGVSTAIMIWLTVKY